VKSTDALNGLEASLQKTRGWLVELEDELDRTAPGGARIRRPDPQEEYHALRAVLHLLRDHLPLPEVAQLGAQLPIVVRGLYYEGWRPASPKERDLAAELARAHHELGGERSLVDPEAALRAAFAVVSRHVSPGELADVTGALPHALRTLLA